MTEPFGDSESEAYAGSGPDVAAPPRAPLWVKVFGIVTLVVIVLFVVVLLVGGGGHGPSRHSDGDNAPSNVTPHTAPVGGHG